MRLVETKRRYFLGLCGYIGLCHRAFDAYSDVAVYPRLYFHFYKFLHERKVRYELISILAIV